MNRPSLKTGRRFAVSAPLVLLSVAALATDPSSPASPAQWTLYKGAAIVKPRVAYASADDCKTGGMAQNVPKTTKFKCYGVQVQNGVNGESTVKITTETTFVFSVDPFPVMTSGMPKIDKTKIPAPNTDPNQVFSTDRVSATDEQAGDSDIGAFRSACSFSHMAFDDPIVYPGQSGKSHLHAFFGNTDTSAASTPDSLLNSGGSTCRGGTVNRSAYWVPALIDTATGAPLVPLSNEPYYKTGYAVPASYVQPMPAGLRMISGDPTASAPQQNIGWHCDTSDGGHFDGASIPTNCKAGTGLLMTVDFPQCWDGVNLDSPNHRSHMAFSNGGQYVSQAQIDARVAAGGPLPPGFQNNLGQQWWEVISVIPGCPPTHPVALPMIQFNVWYQVPTDHPEQMVKWRLASDNYPASQPGGYSAHGDWFNGWKKDISDTWAINCDRAKKDCHSHLLGDGRQIY